MEEDEEGAPSQGIGGVERRGLVDIFGQQVHPPSSTLVSLSAIMRWNLQLQQLLDKADEMEPAVAAAITKAGLWGKM